MSFLDADASYEKCGEELKDRNYHQQWFHSRKFTEKTQRACPCLSDEIEYEKYG